MIIFKRYIKYNDSTFKLTRILKLLSLYKFVKITKAYNKFHKIISPHFAFGAFTIYLSWIYDVSLCFCIVLALLLSITGLNKFSSLQVLIKSTFDEAFDSGESIWGGYTV